MTSSDNQQYVTVEVFNARMDRIEEKIIRLEQMMESNTAELKELKTEIRINTRDIEHVQTSVYWGFAVIAFVIALIGCVIGAAPMLREIYRESKKSSEHEREIQDLREEFARFKMER